MKCVSSSEFNSSAHVRNTHACATYAHLVESVRRLATNKIEYENIRASELMCGVRGIKKNENIRLSCVAYFFFFFLLRLLLLRLPLDFFGAFFASFSSSSSSCSHSALLLSVVDYIIHNNLRIGFRVLILCASHQFYAAVYERDSIAFQIARFGLACVRVSMCLCVVLLWAAHDDAMI